MISKQLFPNCGHFLLIWTRVTGAAKIRQLCPTGGVHSRAETYLFSMSWSVSGWVSSPTAQAPPPQWETSTCWPWFRNPPPGWFISVLVQTTRPTWVQPLSTGNSVQSFLSPAANDPGWGMERHWTSKQTHVRVLKQLYDRGNYIHRCK